MSNLRDKENNSELITNEWVPLVDETGIVTGKASRSAVHNGSKLLHPVVHMHVLKPGKSLLLQKRPDSKLIQPGKWDTAVGGHMSAGETPKEALKKEAFEEIGLTDFSAKFLMVYKWESDLEAELVYLFITNNYKNYHLHSDEVTEAKFWTKNQIENQLGKGIFTANFEHEFALLIDFGLL